jgi:type I restriction enzyme M protein
VIGCTTRLRFSLVGVFLARAGLIFLRYADYKFEQAEQDLSGRSSSRCAIGKVDYQARGVLFLRDQARFANLLKLPDGANISESSTRQ